MKKVYYLLAMLGSFQFLHSQSNLCVTDISFKYYTLSIFTNDGKIYTWGQNPYGQVGNGTTQTQNTPWLRPTTPKFVNIYPSINHAAAVSDDGKIYTWGRNDRGALGDGTIINKLTPVQVGSSTDWVKAQAGNAHTIALKNNGTLWGWGNNSACELTSTEAAPYPNDFYKQPVQLSPDNDWIDIASGGARTFAIKSNGTLWGRGRNDKFSVGAPLLANGTCVVNLTQIGTTADWKKVSSSVNDFTLAIKTNNTLWGWGDNIDGAVGNGTSQLVQTPVQIGNDTWKDVAAGTSYTIGIKSNGTLWGWGRGCWDTSGTIVVPPNSLSPVQVGTDSNWVKVAAGGCGNYALRADNTVWAWGGVFNNGVYTSYTTPTLIFQCESLSTSENDKELSNLVLYPNPTVDKISWAQNIPIEKVSIYDMSARKVLSENVSGSSVNVSHLTNGTYMIRLEKKDKTFYNSKFIKK
ncbi:MAG: hypothetical protein DI622_06825 [Chryseobacterium sp.]|uniref:RCC1 domain-containing protein n=1 Tax=Chryseobacterium sp. TaxID=1871047 RepID=UPI000DB385E9|nr:T9SS type A sorting domain-containing protein [Chryseobacterium sp.]MPS63686.1 T9SS type A sorting domain-containing protein [Chryseobacterium sp.]PZU21595.1 MAG: hypothetical protein DI622_06825 [Chryseobacterium sp.]